MFTILAYMINGALTIIVAMSIFVILYFLKKMGYGVGEIINELLGGNRNSFKSTIIGIIVIILFLGFLALIGFLVS